MSMSMRDEPPKRNWAKTWIHVFVGAVVGALIGLRAWGRSFDAALSTSWLPGLAYIGFGALLVGMIAGLAAESGWDEG